MGGANNPAKKMNFEALKEERTKVQEPMFQNTLVKEPPKTEKPDVQGYRPGDRLAVYLYSKPSYEFKWRWQFQPVYL